MAKKPKLPKKRNTAAFQLATSRSGSGVHGKTKKAKRRIDKMAFKRNLNNGKLDE